MAAFGLVPSELPSEVVSILPADPFAQLELAHKIATYALSSKVSQLEAEGQQLREAMLQKQNHVKTLERRVGTLELELQELQAKGKQAVEEAHRLQSEKVALIDMVKRLNRDVARLEAFKKNLLQHLHEDEEPLLEPSVATADVSGDRLVSEVLHSISKMPPGPARQQQQQQEPGGSHATASVYPGRGHATPSYASTSGRPFHGASTPMAPSPQQPGSYPPAASSSYMMHMQQQQQQPEHPRIDGKEFFRQVRAKLTYEQFSQFLTNVKDLNAGRQTRDETLRRSREIFGPANQDMQEVFDTLLGRGVTGVF